MADYSTVSLLSDAELDAVTGGNGRYHAYAAVAYNSGSVTAASATIGSITTVKGGGYYSDVDVSNHNTTTSFTVAVGALALSLS